MLTNYLCTTQLCQCLYPPVRGGVGQAAPLKDLRPPGPSVGCALCAPSYWRHQDSSPAPAVVSSRKRLRPLSPLLSLIECQWYAWAQSAVPNTVSSMRPSSLAFSLSAVRAVRRLRRFAWGRPGTKGQQSGQARQLTFCTVPPRYGFAVVKPGRYSYTPPPGKTPPEVFRASRMRPSRPLAQTLSVWSTASPFPKLPKTARFRTHQRCGVVFLFD